VRISGRRNAILAPGTRRAFLDERAAVTLSWNMDWARPRRPRPEPAAAAAV